MTAWVYLDSHGRVIGGMEYPADRQKTAPEGALELPEGVSIGSLVGYRWTGDSWVYDPIPSDENPTQEQLDQDRLYKAKKSAKERVNQVSSSVRLRYISDIPGQSALYQEKKAEAQAYLSDPAPVATDYRLLQSDVTAGNASDLYGAAQLILNMANQWKFIVGNLEDIRLKANNDIEAATDLSGVQQAIDTFQQSLSAKGY